MPGSANNYTNIRYKRLYAYLVQKNLLYMSVVNIQFSPNAINLLKKYCHF